MQREDRAPDKGRTHRHHRPQDEQAAAIDDPHDPVDPYTWGLLFTVIEGSRLWHERQRNATKTSRPQPAATKHAASRIGTSLRRGSRRQKA